MDGDALQLGCCTARSSLVSKPPHLALGHDAERWDEDENSTLARTNVRAVSSIDECPSLAIPGLSVLRRQVRNFALASPSHKL